MSFDRLATHYRFMERLLAGGILARARRAHLERLSGKVGLRVLVLGEGPGRFLEVLLASAATESVVVVEESPRMVEEASRRLAPTDRRRVEFVLADACGWEPEAGRFDILATHFFLDCFPPGVLATRIPRWGAGLVEGGCWLVADFQVPADGWRRLRARGIHAAMYLFFRGVTGLRARRWCDPDPFLGQAGFRLEGRACFNHGLVRSDLWRKRPTGIGGP